MVQLLHEFKISALPNEGARTLMKVIKNPITLHLPTGCKKIGTSCKADLVNLNKYVADLNPQEPIVFVIGAMSKGTINADYVENTVSISNYPLSGAVVCSRICQAFEDLWNIQ